MEPNELRKAHPKACAALAAEERALVLAHLEIGDAIDCPAIARRAAKSGTPMAEMLPVYERAAAQHGTSAELQHALKFITLPAAAAAAPATPTSSAPTVEDLAAQLRRSGTGGRDLGDEVVALLEKERAGRAEVRR
jgi:hypothetical protein